MIENEPGSPKTPVQYVDNKDMPKVLYAIFVGQEDEKRIDAAHLIEKYSE